MTTKTKHFLSAIGLYLITVTAQAGEPVSIPEPSVLSLLIAGGIVGAVIAIRKRKK